MNASAADAGGCDYCDRADTITAVNGRRACPDHIEEAMRAAFAPMKAALRSIPRAPSEARLQELIAHAAECLREAGAEARAVAHHPRLADSLDAVALQAEDLLEGLAARAVQEAT